MLKNSVSVTILLMFLGLTAGAQVPLHDPVEKDESLVTGELQNGLQYYIKHNDRPSERVELRFVVKAGSVQEEEHQRGLAHFAEHMCFNGTKNFEKQALVDYLESLGIRFGPELNAFTSFTNTVYMLQIPVDQPGLIDTGYMVLRDWAANVSFDPEEIEKERGVVIEEKRSRKGAWNRMFRKWFPVAFKGTKYAERLPIGKMEVLENFERPAIVDFYNDWYRPDLMGVMVVGDIDIDSTEQKIIDYFGPLENPDSAKPREIYPIPNYDTNFAVVTSDVEATSSELQVFYSKHPKPDVETVEDYRNHIFIPELVNALISRRLEKMREQSDGPFVGTRSSFDDIFWTPVNLFSASAQLKEGRISEGIADFFDEMNRIRLFGFGQQEVDREIKKLAKRYEQRAKEKDKLNSGRLVWQYVEHFMSGEPVPSPDMEYEYFKKIQPTLLPNELNQVVDDWLVNENVTIVLNTPEKKGADIPSESEIMDVFRSSAEKDLQSQIDTIESKPLMANLPPKAEIVSKEENDEFDYTVFTFENGSRLFLKKTDFKNDRISFRAISPGGHSLYPDEDYISIRYLDKYLTYSGVDDFDKDQLDNILAGKDVDIRFWINDHSEGFKGDFSKDDRDTFFKLLHLYFTNPRKDENARDLVVSMEKERFRNMDQNPEMVFHDTAQRIITQGHPRYFLFPETRQLEQINLERMLAIYRERVADAGDYAFFLVGDFDQDLILDIAQRYIGSLASTGQKEKWKDVDYSFPEKTKEVTIYKGIEQKAMNMIRMRDDFSWSGEERLKLKMITDILNIRCRKLLREELGMTYGVRVMHNTQHYPAPKYSIGIFYGASPLNVDTMQRLVFEEMNKLQSEGPIDEDIRKVKKQMIRGRESSVEKNGFWLKYMVQHYFHETPMLNLDEYIEKVSSIDQEDLKNAALKYFNQNQYVAATLKPAKRKEKE